MQRLFSSAAFFFCATALLVALSACGGGGASPEAASADTTQAAAEAAPDENTAAAPDTAAAQAGDSVDVEIEEFTYSRLPDGTRVLTGKLRNTSDKAYSRAQVVVSLYGPDNQRVGTANIDVQDIGVGESTPFRHPLDVEADVRGARVRNVLVF